MARAHFVKSARKKNPVADVGESYWWWKFRKGPKHYSKTPPRSSQLTQSEFLSQVYELGERLEDLKAEDHDDRADLKTAVDEIIDEIRTLGEEQSEKRDNMPDSLQDSETGELLQGRADSCEEWANDLEGVEIEDEDRPIEEILDELRENAYNGE